MNPIDLFIWLCGCTAVFCIGMAIALSFRATFTRWK